MLAAPGVSIKRISISELSQNLPKPGLVMDFRSAREILPAAIKTTKWEKLSTHTQIVSGSI